MPYRLIEDFRPRADAELDAWKHPLEPAGSTFTAAEYYKTTNGVEWLRSKAQAPAPYTEKWYLLEKCEVESVEPIPDPDPDEDPELEGDIEIIDAFRTIVLFVRDIWYG